MFGTNVGVLLHMGQREFLTEDDRIQTIRLYLTPEVMGCAPCMCCALCSNPLPTLCWYVCHLSCPLLSCQLKQKKIVVSQRII